MFDDEGNTVRLHHMNGILGTESMQKGALESTFSHMEKVEPDIYYGTDWDGNKTGKKLAEILSIFRISICWRFLIITPLMSVVRGMM